jgi:hypothetical protein
LSQTTTVDVHCGHDVKIQFIEIDGSNIKMCFHPKSPGLRAMHEIVSLRARLLDKINPALAPHFAALVSIRGEPLQPGRTTSRSGFHWPGRGTALASTRHTATWVNAAVSKDLKTRVDAFQCSTSKGNRVSCTARNNREDSSSYYLKLSLF